ncbi:protein-glutamate methylesterase/protein-glutamine glutaminase [Thalassotalea ganghwensis]
MATIKVLIVDDSSVVRQIIRQVLADDAELEVVGEAKDPFVARELIKKLNPDIITLDVEMPKMDGITFLKNLMRLRPMPVLMLSTLTTHGADITLEALELGAIDFIPKPSFEELVADKDSFKDTLIQKLKSAVNVNQKSYQLSSSLKDNNVTVERLKFVGIKRKNHIIAIGASTGGTEAIKEVLSALPSNSPPIVIAQHIPKTFSARFAYRLDQQSALTVVEAQHGQKIKQGHAYIAPGDRHLTVVMKGESLFCVLEDTPEVNRHKPSVDVLFDSLVPIAENTQAVLLTGMGNDGAKGMANLKAHGAFTIIQDQKSSLIWGMPGSAHKLNAEVLQLPLKQISAKILRLAMLDRKAFRELTHEGH